MRSHNPSRSAGENIKSVRGIRHGNVLACAQERRFFGTEAQSIAAAPWLPWEDEMLCRALVGAVALATVLGIAGARAFDETKYPDWSGQWQRPAGVGVQWDQTKPLGLAQKAPLTPEYQAMLEASLKDQAAGGQGEDVRYTCVPNGMPRIMTAVWPMEFVILPKVTYVNFENNMPRRIYTDGRSFPTN